MLSNLEQIHLSHKCHTFPSFSPNMRIIFIPTFSLQTITTLKLNKTFSPYYVVEKKKFFSCSSALITDSKLAWIKFLGEYSTLFFLLAQEKQTLLSSCISFYLRKFSPVIPWKSTNFQYSLGTLQQIAPAEHRKLRLYGSIKCNL